MYKKTPELKTLRIITFLSFFLLAACEQPAQEYNYSIFTFGTLIDVTVFDNNEQRATAAFEQLQKDFDFFQQNWSSWTDGDLAQINKQIAAGSRDIPVPEHLLPIIKTSMELSRQSNNKFNPAIGRLINLWQFHKHKEKDIKPPQDKLIQALLNADPKMSDISINERNQLNCSNPSVELNFGAFAKGYAIALEIEQLKKMGIQSAVINAGGDLSVIGLHGKRPWNIGIRHPRNKQILASVEVSSDESVFTSGDYERTYYYQGQRYHHILDPATGYPTNDAQSVTVIGKDAGLADAAATAIFVAGRKHWLQTAKNMGIREVMLVDANGDIHVTSSMNSRIKFLDKSPTSHIFVSKDL